MKYVNNEQDLDTLLTGQKAAVLFHATWCPFCRAFRPVFRDVMADNGDWAPIDATIDDEENSLWERYGIEVVPTVIFFDDGQVIRRLDGRRGVGLKQADLRKALAKPAARARGEHKARKTATATR